MRSNQRNFAFRRKSAGARCYGKVSAPVAVTAPVTEPAGPVPGTDEAWVKQILDYSPDAAHDDAPDSAACACRILQRREERRQGLI